MSPELFDAQIVDRYKGVTAESLYQRVPLRLSLTDNLAMQNRKLDGRRLNYVDAKCPTRPCVIVIRQQ